MIIGNFAEGCLKLKSMKYVLILLSFLVLTFDLSAQKKSYSSDSRRAIKLYEEANLYIRGRDFNTAIALLDQAVEKDNDFIEAHLKLAFCYDVTRNLKGQQHHLEEIIRLDKSKKYKNTYYSLGKVYYNQGRYKAAEELLDTYLSFPNQDSRVAAEVEKFKVNIKYALNNIDNPVDFDPKPVGDSLNIFPLQYFPVLTADEKTIFFTRRLGISFYDDEDIYYSEKDENGIWAEPQPISQNINSQFNEGTCTISADGQILILTTCEGRMTYGSCDLYISYKKGDDWTVPKNLGPVVNSRSWESQPSLSADGRRLYFISDRFGGEGKRDIWVTEKDENGEWKAPWNLGPEINTPEDEVSPFIHVNGVNLFFASNGYPGFGGYDLYMAERQSEGWIAPKNLGYPLNDHYDQVSLFVSTNGENGYYSFEQSSEGRARRSFLYTFKYPEKNKLAKASSYLTGRIYDANTGEPLEADIELFDLETNKSLSVFSSNKATGEYFSILNAGGNYGLYVSAPGYLFESRPFNLKEGISAQPIVEDFYLYPIKAGRRTQLNNIYFDFDSYKLKEESTVEIDKVFKFLKKNPEVKIEISGHTDDVGSKEYNKELSEKRAKAVYDRLIEKGIDPAQVSYKGYGMERPLVESGTAKEKEKNRRIEFEVVEKE